MRSSGRFLQTDPVGYKDQVNLYAYVGDDPVNGIDPTGECTGSLFSNSAGDCTTGSGVGPRASDMAAAMNPVADNSRPGQSQGSVGRVNSVNLPQEEAAGGHMIERHVGKSDSFLKARMSAERFCLPFNLLCGGIKRAGTFTSLNSATRLINSTLSSNSARVQQVANGEVNNAFVTARFGSPTEREAFAGSDRETPIIRSTFGVGVLIQHDPSTPSGYRVVTGYPRNDD